MAILRELALDPVTGDLRITNGQLVILQGAEALAQRIQVRLSTFLGEWRFDSALGTPWFESILVPGPRRDLIRSVLAARIRETPGVRRLLELNVDADTTTGVVRVSGRVQAETGDEAELALEVGV